jgi:tetratricopeptide (TPR) repeat protein
MRRVSMLFGTAIAGVVIFAAQPKADLDKANQNYRRAESLLESEKFVEALPLAEEALGLRQKNLDPDSRFIALSQVQVARILNETGGAERAESLLRPALESLRHHRDIRGLAYALNAMGDSYGNRWEMDKAHKGFLEARSLFQKAGDARGEATTINNIVSFRQGCLS